MPAVLVVNGNNRSLPKSGDLGAGGLWCRLVQERRGRGSVGSSHAPHSSWSIALPRAWMPRRRSCCCARTCTAHVPWFFCATGRAGLADGLSTDADMVLEKPVDPVELLTVVGGLLALPRRGERPHYDGAQ